ncbi:MAG: hypothetical protein PVJ15_07420 [Gammaproteobacteria bacterium]
MGMKGTPPPIKALVLTYDRNRCLTDHMIYRYRQLWPDNPFCFRIPYQKNAGRGEADREYIKSPQDLKGTVLALLEGIADAEWIYWCIDDKYPIDLDLPRVKALVEWIRGIDDPEVSGVLFCRPGKLLKKKFLTGRVLRDANGMKYLERRNYKKIWIHQFLRAGVLRHLFESFPDVIPSAKVMDQLKMQVSKPAHHRLFVTARNLATYGESTFRGRLTKNCQHSIAASPLQLPAWHSQTVDKEIVIGKMPSHGFGFLKKLFKNRG